MAIFYFHCWLLHEKITIARKNGFARLSHLSSQLICLWLWETINQSNLLGCQLLVITGAVQVT